MNSQPAYLHGRGRGRDVTAKPSPLVSSSTQRHSQSALGNGSAQQRPGSLPSSGPWSGPNKSPKSPSIESQHLESCKKDQREQSFRSVEDMFAKARSEHLKSAQHHLKSNADDLDDSEDEEEDIGSLVLNGVFKSYANTFDLSDGGDVHSAQEKLLHSFRSGTSACLVCIETIKKEEAIWSCSGCFCMFHLPCIQKWVREGVYQKQYSSGDFATDKAAVKISWHCPKCRHEYSQSECPTRYKCFCGKEPDPKCDPWLVPHSCGNVCGRKLSPNCGHSCLLLCHPGACPPCPVMVKSKCHCEKSAPRMMRCNTRTWACGQICGRTLLCKQHKCPEKCHPGDCLQCTKTSLRACCCGKNKSERACDSIAWNCEKMCGRPLSCGNHICEKICHSESCGNCPRSGLRKCPCEKTEFQIPCTEDIPTCGDTCGKPLACGEHYCTQRCHTGDCGQCMQMAVKKCRCGQKQKEFPCAREFHCDKKCNNLRNCGVHKCNRKCCDGNCPRCEQTCGKTLRCRNHKCASQCHKGPCYPCPLSIDITCNCKSTKITVPCGKERQTKPPRCNLPCGAASECHHPYRQKHRCHFGDCQPCSFVCGVALKGCEHTCPVKCHDAVKTKIQDEGVKAGPWEERPVRIEKRSRPCPPCQVPICVQCIGRHETTQIACSLVKPYSCGRQCGRRLACENHVCQLTCHAVTDVTDEQALAGPECPPCDLGCEAPRPAGCTHPCVKQCHPPPCPSCHMMIRMRCHCQTLLKHIECDKWNSASQTMRDNLKSCEQPCPKELPCGHPCGAVCHKGPCPNTNRCQKKVTLKCRCKRLKKEIVCAQRETSMKVECDSNCKPNAKIFDELAKQREEEEKKKQEAELLEFERMMKGRKKKPRKQREEVQEETFWSKYKIFIIPLLLGVVTAIGVLLYLKTQHE